MNRETTALVKSQMGGVIMEGFNEINYWKTVPDKIRLEILNKSISDGDHSKDSRKKRKNN